MLVRQHVLSDVRRRGKLVGRVASLATTDNDDDDDDYQDGHADEAAARWQSSEFHASLFRNFAYAAVTWNCTTCMKLSLPS